jgi:threonyl-tRNA synthetase
VFGSVERFIGILIEHFAGQFPTWLAPTQVKVLPISEKYEAYAAKVTQQLQDADIRASLDERNETLKFKIRDAHMKRIPYTVIVGAKEEENGTISLRSRFAGDEGSKRVDEFIESIHEEIASKAIRESIQEEK